MTGKNDREEKQKNRTSAPGCTAQDWMVDAVIYTKIRAAKECDIAVNYNDGQGQSAARKLVGPVVVSALRDYAMPKV